MKLNGLLCSWFFLIVVLANAQSRLVMPVMHNGSIFAFDDYPAKKLLLTGDSEGVIKLWESETGKEIYTLNEVENELVGLKFIEEGNYFASFGSAGLVKIWDTQKGVAMDTLNLNQPMNGAWKIASNQWVIFSTEKAALIELLPTHQWELKEIIPGNWASYGGEERKEFFDIGMGPLHVNKKWVLTLNSSRSRLSLKKWSGGENIQKWQWEEQSIQTAEFTPDGKYIFVGLVENRWKVIDAETFEVIYENNNFDGAVLDFAFHPHQKKVLISSDDHVCREFDYSNGTLLFSRKMKDPVNESIGAFYSDHGSNILITDFTKECEMYNAEDHTLKYTYHEEFEPHHMIITSVDEKFMYVFHRRFWRKIDIGKGKDLFIHSFSPFSVLNKFEGPHDWLISSTYGRVFIANSKTGKNIYEGKYLSKSMTTSLLHASKEFIILGGNDKILFWEFKKQDSLKLVIEDRRGTVSCLRWNKDSTSFFASAGDRKVVQYRLPDFKSIREIKFDAVGSEIVCFEVLEDQDLMIMVGEDNAIHYY